MIALDAIAQGLHKYLNWKDYAFLLIVAKQRLGFQNLTHTSHGLVACRVCGEGAGVVGRFHVFWHSADFSYTRNSHQDQLPGKPVLCLKGI
jgi:hypothetical protein